MSLLSSLRISRNVAAALIVLVLVVAFTGAALGQAGGEAPVAQGPAPQEPTAPDVSTAFTYQGQLTNSGALVNDDCDFQFLLWTAGSGGSSIGPVTTPTVPVSDGRFTVLLDFGANFPIGADRWLEVKVRCPAGGGAYTSLGRQRLTATPYAQTANTASNADTVDGYHANTIQNSHTHAGQAWSTGASYGLYAEGASYGLYGVGSAYGVYAISPDNIGVLGDGGAGAGDYGGYFTGYSGVFGNAENGSGYGVYGQSVSTSIDRGAVTGVNNATACCAAAVSGIATNGTDNFGFGVVGQADYLGVYGIAPSGTRGDNGSHWGVYGVGGGTNGYGVYSAGPAQVTGFLTKSGGGFKIDHPQDPENKYLIHSFVESPDMMNVYNGNVLLDANGEAWVAMPGYFESLNMDFRYQLTPIGGPGPNLYVASEIQDNRFQIAGGEPGLKVSWQVTGIRNDPWAQANRPAVEPVKSGDEQGTLLHPEVYGQPVEMGYDYQFGPSAILRASETNESTDGR